MVARGKRISISEQMRQVVIVPTGLKSVEGNAINAGLSAAAMNFHKLLASSLPHAFPTSTSVE
jgi:hypothetical protein